MTFPEALAVLEVLGYERTQANADQLMAIFSAFETYAQRNARHTDTWKDSGWRGALFDIRKKIDRLWNEYMISDTPPNDLDSAIDAINYLAFFIRARETGVEGNWRWK
jgi:hypothetical protein